MQYPRLAILDGTYGAGFGPQAAFCVVHSCRSVAVGAEPVRIYATEGHKVSLSQQIRLAKEQGCVALIAEIVRSRDGKTLPTDHWKRVIEACADYGLCLVVDEALTAIRCGAPFAHQTPEYARFGHPDFILFGKAMRTSGLAVDWQGINLKDLEVRDPEHLRLHWQKRFTEPVSQADLILSLGTLKLAAKENWPERARRVGKILRSLAPQICPKVKPSHLGGLCALIYLRRKQCSDAGVMFAEATTHLVRWLPTLDEVMTSLPEINLKIFGLGSLLHRKQLAKFLSLHEWVLPFCF